MTIPIISTKLYMPLPRSNVVIRPRLIERLNEGLHRKLTLISASAGFGKTTLVSEWLAGCEQQAAWLSLEEGDNDPIRFLIYLVAALQTIAAKIGEGVFAVLQSPQPPPAETILTALLNEITAIPDNFVLVLDDYHVIEAKPIEDALTFLLKHLPPQMHLVIATREDPPLPLARLRVRGQLTELRSTDLRFTPSEAAGFLGQVMGLNLSSANIALLETRTEGWIAGLQLAAISLQGHKDAASFIKSFNGSHRYVLDYLVEEVLQQQSESVQAFLLCTSILDRMCGPLCDAVLLDSSASGQETLNYLERANLFIVPLDNDRRWYRYHHLFADLLRQRLHQSAASSTGDEGRGAAELHKRASIWYEDNGLEIEAFHHAAAANDVERAARLVEGEGMPLHFRGAAGPVLNWLESLQAAVLDARPSLWVTYASALLFASRPTGVEQKLRAAEAALQGAGLNDKTRDLIGHIAAIRASVAVSQHQVETIITQSHRALEYLDQGNLPVRTAMIWTQGYAYHLQGDRAAARQAYTEAIYISQTIGHFIITIMATIGLGNLQEADNELDLAADTYRRVLQLAGDPPLPVACEAHLGLARISCEWNDMDAALRHGQQSVQMARQIENTDRFISCEVFLARLKLAQGDVAAADAILAKADQLVRQHNFMHQMREVAAAQVLVLLRQGNPAAAAHLAQTHELLSSLARVHLAQGEAAAALAALEPMRRQAEAKGWKNERLKVMVLQAVALHEHGDMDMAVQLLGDALLLAEPGGFIRIFVDEGIPMAGLLTEAAAHGIMPGYIGKLLAVFESGQHPAAPAKTLIEPLSERELNVLQLIAQGLSNREISERLFLALSSVKGHNQNIFGKLQVRRRTEAVARARELGLL
ncbi:LuxR C-terminal-related transcriptional regulator [Paenibacillus harenae]|uniref:LuxR C-terminal-related transcriptional regulator n=1 Tax=Paenibacillus harenae TaxID=306543 RepID=UPI00048C6668|nr:LuxR C-terminal-related transcriptional regulator [Paenibacillus harenae]